MSDIPAPRHIPDRLDKPLSSAIFSWEALLVVVAVAIFAFNGLLVTRLGLPSIVVTIGTMSLFRGIAFIILGDQAYKGYPESFAFFGQGYVWWVVSFELVLFLVAAVVYWFLLHRTSFGRR